MEDIPGSCSTAEELAADAGQPQKSKLRLGYDGAINAFSVAPKKSAFLAWARESGRAAAKRAIVAVFRPARRCAGCPELEQAAAVQSAGRTGKVDRTLAEGIVASAAGVVQVGCSPRRGLDDPQSRPRISP
jgi:hypothetical protein